MPRQKPQFRNMAFDREQIKKKAAALAAKGVFVGTSSWKYEGWLGQFYMPARYEYRGKAAKTRFERDCLGIRNLPHASGTGLFRDERLSVPSSWLIAAVMRFQALFKLVQLFGPRQLVGRFCLGFRRQLGVRLPDWHVRGRGCVRLRFRYAIGFVHLRPRLL